MGYKTYNVELKMDTSMEQYWLSMLSQLRNAFNVASKMVVEEKIPLGIKQFHDKLYKTLREKFPSLPSQCIIKTYKEVLSKFRAIKTNKHDVSNAPRKKCLSLTLDREIYSRFTADGIALKSYIPHKRIRCELVLYPKVRELFEQYSTSDPILFVRDSRFFLSIPFNVPDRPCLGELSIGVDMGVKRLFVTSEGKAFVDKIYLKERRKVRYLKRHLASSKTRSSKRHLKKISRREKNLSKDMTRRAVNELIRNTDANIIVIENLKNIKERTSKTKNGHKRKKHNNMFSQIPLFMFRNWLAHKATLSGKRVVSVSPTYTSQIDSRTNKRNGARCGCRYVCSDGVVLDADWNAAINIAMRANHPVSKNLPIDGRLTFLTGRVQSNTRTPKRFYASGKPINI